MQLLGTVARQKFRLSGLPLASSIVVALGFVALAAMLAFLSARMKWTYGAGILGALVFLFTLFVLRRFDLSLVLYLVALFVGDYYLALGYMVGTLRVDFSEFFLVVILINGLVLATVNSQSDTRPLFSRVRLSRVDFLFALFVLSLGFSTMMWTDTSIQALRSWLHLGPVTFIVFVLVRAVLRAERSQQFLIALLAVVLLLSLNENLKWVLGESLIPMRWDPGYDYEERIKLGLGTTRVVSMLGYPSFAGAFWLLFLPFSFALAVGDGDAWKRILGALSCVSMLINLVLYVDRGSWLGLAAAIVVLAVFSSRRSQVGVLGLAVLLVFLTAHMLGILIVISIPDSIGSFASQFAESIRITIWSQTIEALPNLPYFGIGWQKEAFGALLQRYATTPFPLAYIWTTHYFYQPHNSYLHLLVVGGFLPFITFVSMLGYVFWRCLTGILHCPRGLNGQLLLALFAGLVGFSVEAMFDRTFWIPPLHILFWLMVGLALTLISAMGDENGYRTAR